MAQKTIIQTSVTLNDIERVLINRAPDGVELLVFYCLRDADGQLIRDGKSVLVPLGAVHTSTLAQLFQDAVLPIINAAEGT